MSSCRRSSRRMIDTINRKKDSIITAAWVFVGLFLFCLASGFSLLIPLLLVFYGCHLAMFRGVQASRHSQRTITAIRKVADQPTQCIEVDSPSHLYLAGDSMIPTHNSTTSALAVLWFALTRDAAGRDWK